MKIIDEMRDFIKSYMRQNKDLLMKNDLDSLYEKSYNEHGSDFTPFLTEFLFECGVDPLNYFKETVPVLYANQSDRYKNVVIPEGIKHVLYGAFSQSDTVTSVRFPSSIKHINPGALYYCPNLETVIFPRSFKEEVQRKKFLKKWGSPKVIYY